MRRHNQQGVVSIMVTVILMIVVSLTVLGFAQIIRREQRTSLDNQLNTQAYYAAESGINNVASYISTNFTSAGQAIPQKTMCGTDPSPTSLWHNFTVGSVLDPSTNASYTCVLVNANPGNLKYDLTTDSGSVAFPVDTSADASPVGPISTLSFSWTKGDPSNLSPTTGCPSAATASLPSTTNWTCGYGVLRVDIVPGQSLNRSSFAGNQFTAFLMPTTGGSTAIPYTAGGNINSGTANQGVRAAATCDGVQCQATINVSSVSSNLLYVRAMMLYRNSTVSVTAYNSGNAALQLNNAQIMVDVTGKSQDVLKRIQVRMPLSSGGTYADYALQSIDSICKAFSSYDGYSNTANASCN